MIYVPIFRNYYENQIYLGYFRNALKEKQDTIKKQKKEPKIISKKE